MNFTRTLIAAALIATSGATFAQAIIDQNRALAGNITPGDTAGFPITISQPGSYKLTSNLFVPSGTSGIVITAPNVTLDMNGFSLVGPVTCTRDTATRVVTCSESSGSKHGITTNNDTTVRNGNVQGFNGAGLQIAGMNNHLERVHVSQNTSRGFATATGGNEFARLVDCAAVLNRSSGAVLVRAIVTGSRFNYNGADGIGTLNSTLVLDSQAIGNFLVGISGATVNRTASMFNGTNVQSELVLGVNMNQDNSAAY